MDAAPAEISRGAGPPILAPSGTIPAVQAPRPAGDPMWPLRRARDRFADFVTEGVEMILADDKLRGDTPIFIAGDASHDRPVPHETADEGRIAGENEARLPDARPGPYRGSLAIVFCDPQIAIVGGGFDAANARYALLPTERRGRPAHCVA